MRIECPKCGKTGNIPSDGGEIRSIRCPACKTSFLPTLETRTEPSTAIQILKTEVLPTVQVTKECVFCGESIMQTALKCRHCNEIVDPTYRATIQRSQPQSYMPPAPPTIIHNNISTHASSVATAVAIADGRPSILARLGRLIALTIVLVGIGGYLISTTPEQNSPKLVLGVGLVACGGLLFVIGLPYLLLTGLFRALFG